MNARSAAWLWLALAAICLPLTAVRLVADPSSRVVQAAAVMTLLCALLAWRGLRVLRGDDDLDWSVDGLEGPGRRFGPLVGGPRTRIVLPSNVRHAGWGVWCAEGQDGQRVYWSEAHEGHDDLLARLGVSA